VKTLVFEFQKLKHAANTLCASYTVTEDDC